MSGPIAAEGAGSYRRSQSPTGPPSSMSTTSTTSSTSTIMGSKTQPLHLQPPTGINILPPSPIDGTSGSPFSRSPIDDRFGSGHNPGSMSKEKRPSLSPLPLAADALSVSPTDDAGLLLSPSLSRTVSNESTGSGSGTGTGPLGTRAPSPSSPNYRPKRINHHRRTSSTHKVRETVDGEQKTTAEGRMVNQYKIGDSLGHGAYAKVELGVDITTGEEFVSLFP